MINFSFKRFLAEARLVFVGGESFDTDYEDEEGGGDTHDLIDQAERLAKSSGINILRNMEIEYVAMEGHEVVGALWCGRLGDEFSFDVVVSPSFQRRGIGKQLIDAAMQSFNDFSMTSDDAHIMAHVVNPFLIPGLLARGFVEINPGGPHTGKYLRYPPPDDEEPEEDEEY